MPPFYPSPFKGVRQGFRNACVAPAERESPFRGRPVGWVGDGFFLHALVTHPHPNLPLEGEGVFSLLQRERCLRPLAFIPSPSRGGVGWGWVSCADCRTLSPLQGAPRLPSLCPVPRAGDMSPETLAPPLPLPLKGREYTSLTLAPVSPQSHYQPDSPARARETSK